MNRSNIQTPSYGGVPTQFINDVNIVDRHDPVKGKHVVENNELVITKATASKVSAVTKNGRYISRITDAIDKLNKRDGSQKDKNLFNLVLVWDVRQRLLLNDQFDNNEVYNKYVELSTLLNKFDQSSDDYRGYMNYLLTQLDNLVSPTFDVEGIPNFNYFPKNYCSPDIFGYTTYHKDRYLSFDDLDYSDQNIFKTLGNPEVELPDIVEKVPEHMMTEVPKLIHLVYYKTEIDTQHLFVNLSTFTANRDFQIIIWMKEKPNIPLPTGDHVSCKEFHELENFDVNNKFAKYMLKYQILKEYGGIYLDYTVYGVKKFNPEIVKQCFFSTFIKKIHEIRYVCPLTVFMGFTANHPLLNYILEHFEEGIKTCGTEFIYIRSALVKSGNKDIKLLYQDIRSDEYNKSYILLYNQKQVDEIAYFKYADFDVIDEEGEDNDRPQIAEKAENIDKTTEQELKEMDKLATQTVAEHTKANNYSNWPFIMAFLAGIVWLWIDRINVN